MVERLDAWATALGPWAYLLLGAAALIEYVFPPFPGDSVVLLGGVYAARGQRSWALVLLAVTLGSVAGAAADWWVGTRVTEEAASRRWPRLKSLRASVQHRAVLLLVVNRFLPGLRALIFVAAGAAGVPFRTVLVWGALSAAVFNGAVIAAGFALGGNAERLAELFGRYQHAVLFLMLALGVAWVVRWAWRRRR